MNDIQRCSHKLYYSIPILLCSLLFGQSNDAYAKYPNPPCLAKSIEYASIEPTDTNYPAYVPERESFNPPENPGFLSNYLNRCQPCRTSLAMSDEEIREDYQSKTCETRICPPNPYDLFTYFGVNYKQFWVHPINDWQRLFVRSNPGFNFYFGGRIYTFFGVEIGYEWTANKPIATLIDPGTSLLGLTNTNPFPVRISSKQRLRSGYIDANLFIPLFISHYFQPEGIFSIGVAAVKSSVKLQIFPYLAEPYHTQLRHLNGRGKTLLRIGAGMQSLIINNIGLRIMCQWQDTADIKFQQSPVAYAPATRHIFKNSYNVSAGLYFYF